MWRMIRRGLAVIAAVVTAAMLTTPTPVSAQQSQPGSAALSVSPPTSSIDVAPGQKYTKKVGLDNISDIERQVTIDVQNFVASGEDGHAALTTDEGVYSLKQWISVSPTKATLKPHGHQDFDVTITVPPNAPPGGHFGALVFSPAAPGSSEGASLSVVSQVVSLVLLRVPGDAKEDAAVESFNICKIDPSKKDKCEKSKSFFTGGDLSINTRIRNNGNVQVMPTGTITVRNMFGKKVAELQLKGAQVLPESVRRFETEWKSKRPIGQYKISADLKYGDAQQTLSSSKTIYVLPVGVIGVIVGLLLAGFFLGWLPRKRWKAMIKAFKNAGNE